MKCASFLLALCVFQAGHSAKGEYIPRQETIRQISDAFAPVHRNYWNAVKDIKPNLSRTKELSALMDKCLKKSSDANTAYTGQLDIIEHKCDQLYEEAIKHSQKTKYADLDCGILIKAELVDDEQDNVNAAVTCVKACLQPGAHCK